MKTYVKKSFDKDQVVNALFPDQKVVDHFELLPEIKNKWIGKDYATPEMNDEPSLTIPDQTLTIKQIYDRFTRGLTLTPNQRNPVYNGDIDIPDYENMDLADREEALQDAKTKLENITDAINQATKAKKETSAKKQNITDIESEEA